MRQKTLREQRKIVRELARSAAGHVVNRFWREALVDHKECVCDEYGGRFFHEILILHAWLTGREDVLLTWFSAAYEDDSALDAYLVEKESEGFDIP